MAKPYFLFKRPSDIWYARIQLPDGSQSNNRSTGCRDRNAPERVVMEWVVNNKLPNRINSIDDKQIGLDKISVLNSLRIIDLDCEDVQKIISILKEREFIHSAVMMASPESKPIDDYIKEFWAFETSPYVKEKKLKGGSIHRDYCEAMLIRASKYWLPSVTGKPVGCITHDDVTALFDNQDVLKLSPKTINSVVSSVTIPLKWAYFHNLTEINCFDGILKYSQKSEKREILTMEQAAAVFASDWDNETAKLANAVAFEYEYKMQLNSRRLTDGEYFAAILKLDEIRRSNPNAQGSSDEAIGRQLNKSAQQVCKMREIVKRRTLHFWRRFRTEVFR